MTCAAFLCTFWPLLAASALLAAPVFVAIALSLIQRRGDIRRMHRSWRG